LIHFYKRLRNVTGTDRHELHDPHKMDSC